MFPKKAVIYIKLLLFGGKQEKSSIFFIMGVGLNNHNSFKFEDQQMKKHLKHSNFSFF